MVKSGTIATTLTKGTIVNNSEKSDNSENGDNGDKTHNSDNSN